MSSNDKQEHEKEIQERRERRQLMASARAERARKRSSETSPTTVIPVKRKDYRGRKGKMHEYGIMAVREVCILCSLKRSVL